MFGLTLKEHKFTPSQVTILACELTTAAANYISISMRRRLGDGTTSSRTVRLRRSCRLRNEFGGCMVVPASSSLSCSGRSRIAGAFNSH